MATALITGASRGLGQALGRALADQGWDLIVDARDGAALQVAVSGWSARKGAVTAIAGDVTDPQHRDALAAAVRRLGGLDLLVNNASTLGPTPLRTLVGLTDAAYLDILTTNTVAPIGLVRAVLPQLQRAGGTVVNVTSDAAVEPYETWGGYGSSKAALDHASAILGAEQPGLAVYAFDPGDMRTDMQQAAFPGEDISDRPAPETVVPVLLDLVERRLPSGRYTASRLAQTVEFAAGGRS